MRILVHAAADGRLAMAARGLAGRGHEIGWTRADLAGDQVVLPRRRERWSFHPQVVVSAGSTPAAAGLEAMLSATPCLVLDLAHAKVSSWRLPDRWAWQAWRALGLVDPIEAPLFHEQPLGLELDRVALWSDEPIPSAADPAHPDVEVLERACERARARHRTQAARPAVFLDRDGTLVHDTGYIADPDGIELLPGVGPALRELSAAGYPLVVISNQAGVGRGLFDLASAHRIMGRMRRELLHQGVDIEAVYFCPHRPDEGCACRKPGVALLERAAEDLRLGLRVSYMVGDKWIDLEAGRRVGATSILVRTGYGREDEERLRAEGRAPAVVVDDMEGAARWILARGE